MRFNEASLVPAPNRSDVNSASSSSPAPAAPTTLRTLTQTMPAVPTPPGLAAPATQNQLIRLTSSKDVQHHILHPLRQAIEGDFPNWTLPVGLNVGGVWVPLNRLHEAFVFDYESIIGTAVLQHLQVQEWKVQFYEAEPDPTPPFAKDRPRLDILVIFTNGTWLRWHPDADLIWSTTPQPTAAMHQRMNRKKFFLKQLKPAQ